MGVILVTVYRPGAAWRPERRSAGQGALALMANTLPARDPPARALAATRRAAEDCVVLEGERGEAETIAADVLATAANGPPPATRSLFPLRTEHAGDH